MSHHLIRKLDHCVCLSASDRERLRWLVRDVAWFRANQDMIDEGAALRQVSVILEGWACCYKQLEDGRRHITAYLIPGDVCSMPFFFPNVMNCSIRALTSVRVGRINEPDLRSAMEGSPVIARAFWLDMLATAAIQREWTANVGLRTARERIAHLLCEVVTRMRAVGLVDQDSCILPLTQEDIGETVGLSTVHVNRTLQELRASGLIRWKRQNLTIPDFNALSSVAYFDSSYLCLAGMISDMNQAPGPLRLAFGTTSPPFLA